MRAGLQESLSRELSWRTRLRSPQSHRLVGMRDWQEAR
jgi:hypothetical protein